MERADTSVCPTKKDTDTIQKGLGGGGYGPRPLAFLFGVDRLSGLSRFGTGVRDGGMQSTKGKPVPFELRYYACRLFRLLQGVRLGAWWYGWCVIRV